MTKATFFIFLLLLISGSLQSQYVDETEESSLSALPFHKRLVYGGGLGANFGTGYTIVDISPMVGYKATDRLIPGVGLSYTYYQFLGESFSFYGGSLWTRYMIADNFMAHTEFQELNMPFYTIEGELQRDWVPMWLVGGGYHTGRGSGIGFSVMVLWDLIDDPRSPYQNPIIRGGVMLGF
ncbi:MAG: hypothetical protein JNM00_01505 [Flavobacteriales bacterium]|nr:hypothetical protein [Flavobacteriales bacterium]